MTEPEYEEVRAMVTKRAERDGCCGNDAWRGLFCPYHQGYLDGLLDAIEAE